MFVVVCKLFSKLTFSKNLFRGHYQSVKQFKKMDPDQDQHSVHPELGPNCLQRLSADIKNHHKQGKSQPTYGPRRYKICLWGV